jgi:hypothetical protein
MEKRRPVHDIQASAQDDGNDTMEMGNMIDEAYRLEKGSA